MAGCIPCFIIPLLLFIFHRYIQPIILTFWNPWDNKSLKDKKEEDTKEPTTELPESLSTDTKTNGKIKSN